MMGLGLRCHLLWARLVQSCGLSYPDTGIDQKFVDNTDNSGRKPNKMDGFTLIEVLAALLIFSLAILGLMQSTTQSLRATQALETKMLAGIIADNQLTLTRARARAADKSIAIETGLERGETEQLSQKFNYFVNISETDIPTLFQVVVRVSAFTPNGSNGPDDGQILEQRLGFISQRDPVAAFSIAQAAPTPDPDASSDIDSDISQDFGNDSSGDNQIGNNNFGDNGFDDRGFNDDQGFDDEDSLGNQDSLGDQDGLGDQDSSGDEDF